MGKIILALLFGTLFIPASVALWEEAIDFWQEKYKGGGLASPLFFTLAALALSVLTIGVECAVFAGHIT